MRPRSTQLLAKRVLDVVISSVVLLGLLPLWLLIAIVVVLDNPGPPIFTQVRVGKNRVPFRLLKFRTMVKNAEDLGAGHAFVPGDPRITRMGRWLRRSSLDEIPQLVNVLLGHQSIVGPRAVLPETASLMSEAQKRRFDVRPGITGWAQINGRNDIPWSTRITLDLWYIDHFALWLDIRIMLRTIVVVIRRTGVRQDQNIDTVYDFDHR